MNLNDYILLINSVVWGWPLLIFIGVSSLVVTIALGGVQLRYFFRSWHLALKPQKQEKDAHADMSSFQAFLNALSSSLGNGSLAGTATAVVAGGPGAAFWVFVFGLLSMSFRFCEVYLSAYFGGHQSAGGVVGGPMVYLGKIPGKRFLPYIYALFCIFLSLVSGNAMQANSIRLGMVRLFNLDPLIIAVLLLVFMIYVMMGGAQRIIAVSDKIVPVKVGVFFGSMIIALAYHYQAIIPALQLIFEYAFTTKAAMGAAIGYSMQSAIRFGVSRSLNASEAGLGTAAVIFGGSTSKNPVNDGIMGMLSSFISANLVCFSLMVLIVASGVWESGLDSINLTIAAYETVFGSLGAWIVTFLTMSFGLGVLVAYAYIGRACWLFLTNGRCMILFNLMYSSMAFFGAIAQVALVWNSVDLVNAGLVMMNLFAILMLLPLIKKGLASYQKNA